MWLLYEPQVFAENNGIKRVVTFDYDNRDGHLDLFFVNMPLMIWTEKGTTPRKRSPKDWNRLYHQRKDGTFEDVTEKAGLKGVGYDI